MMWLLNVMIMGRKSFDTEMQGPMLEGNGDVLMLMQMVGWGDEILNCDMCHRYEE